MVYLQITTVCNMRCPHCMFDCTDGGRHMPMEVVGAACDWAVRNQLPLFVGGGEPTCHPCFWDVLHRVRRTNEAVGWTEQCGLPPVGLVTNGHNLRTANRLLRMALAGKVHLSVSHDFWHRTETELDYGLLRRLRTAGSPNVQLIQDAGRLLRLGRMDADYAQPGCGGGLHIDPDGTLWRCNCRTERLGNLLDECPRVENWDLGCSTTSEERPALVDGW